MTKKKSAAAIQLRPHSQVKVVWNTTSYDYSEAKKKDIEEAFAKKYGIDRKCVKALANFLTVDKTTGKEITLQEDVIGDIQSPEFVKSLFEPYLQLKGVENYDLKALFDIDAEVNSRVDFQSFENKRTYKLRWLRWDNFESYGPGNFFDFRTIEGLTLLNSNPANQGGKTTFAIELLHFVFFGKTRKFDTQDQFFNDRLPEATTLLAEACIEIEGDEYVIRRTLKRPALAKRTEKSKTTSTLEYFRKAGDELVELKDESLNGESVGATNQIIKEAVGRESDFDLVICTTSRNLEDLIIQEKTERGRLLARWIGLALLEEKEKIGKELYAAKTKTGMYSNTYNTESLNAVNEEQEKAIAENELSRAECDKTIDGLKDQIACRKGEIEGLMSQRRVIDTSVESININSCNTRLENVTAEGKAIAGKIAQVEQEITGLGVVEDCREQYRSVTDVISDIKVKMGGLSQEINNNAGLIKSLKEGEYCPTCHRKYDNVDNGPRIAELQGKNRALIVSYNALEGNLVAANADQFALRQNMDRFDRKSRLETQLASLTVQRNDLRNEYREISGQIERYKANKEAIEVNTRIAGEINLVNANIRTLEQAVETNIQNRSNFIADTTARQNTIKRNNEIIARLAEEAIFMRNWKLYLDIVGKNGITKMVLRKALPVINANLANLLDEVCNFTVELEINDKNEVQYYIVKEGGVRAVLKSGSGLENTLATLALRTVLFNISALSKPNFTILDEILGAVAKENYDKVHDLYNKIAESYDFIIQITHLDEVKDWHRHIITVNKVNNISRLSVESMG